MTIENILSDRSGATCELCGSQKELKVYEVKSGPVGIEPNVLICEVCLLQIASEAPLDTNHWRCLNTSMWSDVPAVQVLVWRILSKLVNQGQAWAQDLLDTLYLDEDMLRWANATEAEMEIATEVVIHKDSNGTPLASGDTVVLIKDLDVKGGGFTAKRGTAVRGISLVENNAGQIEGRVNGQQIVILTQYVKKS
jgi:protein PhnA